VRRKQLECRIVIRHGDLKTEVGMYDPLGGRYESLGAHGPLRSEVDRVVRDLKVRMEREGHRVSFSEITGRR